MPSIPIYYSAGYAQPHRIRQNAKLQVTMFVRDVTVSVLTPGPINDME